MRLAGVQNGYGTSKENIIFLYPESVSDYLVTSLRSPVSVLFEISGLCLKINYAELMSFFFIMLLWNSMTSYFNETFPSFSLLRMPYIKKRTFIQFSIKIKSPLKFQHGILAIPFCG